MDIGDVIIPDATIVDAHGSAAGIIGEVQLLIGNGKKAQLFAVVYIAIVDIAVGSSGTHTISRLLCSRKVVRSGNIDLVFVT